MSYIRIYVNKNYLMLTNYNNFKTDIVIKLVYIIRIYIMIRIFTYVNFNTSFFANPFFMIEEIIVYGNLFVVVLELFLSMKQKFTLFRSKFDEKAKLMIADEKEYDKMKNYNLEKLTFSNLNEIFAMLKLFCVIKYKLQYNLYLYLQKNYKIQNEYILQIITMILMMAIDKLTTIPFSIISNFYIEAKYGFNKMTMGLFISDYVKSEVLIYIIASPICYAMLYLIDSFPDSFYTQLFITIALTQLILIMLFPIVIQPLFNKFEELKEGELKVQIIELAKKIRFKPSKILTMDGSKRSHHSNAYFVGIFKEKRIVLFDTLLEQNTNEEILAILCHEFGHWYYSHTFKQIVNAMATMFIYIYSFNYFVKQKTSISYFPMILKIAYFGMLLGFISPLMTLFVNSVTRYYERQADKFAVKHGYGNELKNGLIKLHVKNKSNMCPDSWYSAYHHSHPTLFERINLIDAEMKKTE